MRRKKILLFVIIIACYVCFTPNVRAFEAPKKVVIFVHGFTESAAQTWGNFPSLIPMDPALKGMELFVWDYPSSIFRSNPSVELLGKALLSDCVANLPIMMQFTSWDTAWEA